VTAEPGRVLAIDLGTARIGLALSDPGRRIAQPLAALRHAGHRKALAELGRIVREREVRRVVVGLPLLLSGAAGPAADGARRFAAQLASALDEVDVELWDERLTTVEAERVLLAADVKRERRREAIDSLAAVLILQGYLDAQAAEPPR
jgi:putative Holliday junction resolvase